MVRFVLVAAAVMGTAAAASAEPVVTGVSGAARHGEPLTVQGSGFGTKVPAAPLVWDDGSAAPPLSSVYDEALPTSAQQGSAYNMAYRAVPFRGLDAPHAHGVQYILGGAHATNTSADMYASGNNVSVGKNMTSFHYFAQYWYRVDPLFDESNHPTLGENMKELCLSGAPNKIYGGRWGYYNWCNGQVPDANFRSPVRLSRLGVDCPSLPYSCSTDPFAVAHANPVNGWVKMQWEGDYDTAYDNPTVRLTTYPDGKVSAVDHYGSPLTTYEITTGCGNPPAAEMRFLGIGGFARVPRTNNGTNSFRYFSGIYLDDTRARVMLGDRADYASCTVMEPQVPRSWSDGAIEVQVNLGALPDEGAAYLFVFDEENRHSAVGYPVTLEPPGAAAPARPRNLRAEP